MRLLPVAVGLGDALLEHALPSLLLTHGAGTALSAPIDPDGSTLLLLLRRAYDHSSWGRKNSTPQQVASLLEKLGLNASGVPHAAAVEAAMLGFAAASG